MGAQMRNYSKSRIAIDFFDEKILELLALRMDEVEVIGDHKSKSGTPVKDESRETKILLKLEERGTALGLESEMIRDVFSVIIKWSCMKQENLHKLRPE